jgi:hypothetical protein
VTVSSGRGNALRNGLKVTVVVVAGWLLLAWPAWWLAGPQGLEGLSLAAALCLIPGWLVFAIQSQYGTAAPLAALLAATAGRMAAVLLGALTVKALRPDLGMTSFGIWLGAFYVLALATETKLLLPPGRRTTSDE